MKYILDIIFSLLILVISKFTRNNKSWLLGAREGEAYADNGRYFFEWLLSNTDEDCFWVTKNKKVYNILLSEGKPVLYFYNFRNIYAFAKAQYVVCTHSYTGNDVFKFVSNKRVLITLWHGIPLKKMSNSKYNKKDKFKRFFLSMFGVMYQPDLFLVTSDKDIDVFSGAFGISNENFFIGSYPRMIDLISNAKAEKTILYAPTFRDRQLQPYYDDFVFPTIKELTLLNEMLILFGYIFKIKLHPYTSALFTDVTELSNIEITTKESDVQELLYGTEILITDYSSIYFDFLSLKRDIVFFTPDFDWYYDEANRGLIYEYGDVTPGKKITNWGSLIEHLAHCIEYGDSFSLDRMTLFDKFFQSKSLNNIDLYQKCKSIKK